MIFQACMNLCVVVGLIPVTGVTLPFLSYGGSSLLISMLSVGILLNVSRNNGWYGKYVWEFSHGSISEFYSAFRDRGISFEHDIYDEIDRKHQQILKYSKDNKLFNREN